VFQFWNDEFRFAPLVTVGVLTYSPAMEKGIPALIALLGLFSSPNVWSQAPDNFPDYVPLLPAVKAKALAADPQKGYLVKELKPGIFMITDGAYESVFATTGKGVVLFDAPPSFAQHIVSAVSETTKEPIVELVYTHLHVDHIGGAGIVLQSKPDLQIVAESGTAEFLREMHDPHRPIPTRTFKDHETLRLGSLTADMKVGHWHSPEGDLLIYVPDRKFVICIDSMSAGATPFMGLDLTMNMREYLKIFDTLLALDFDVMVPGHHSTPATKDDVRTAKDYVMDVYNTVSRLLGGDHRALTAQASRKYGDK
jgi:glyoxylase-like metal-dependent hydrolase (beta-lactamase superfamily II)